jgi:hypothetical protein
MPMPPSPTGVETAQIVSWSDMGVYYHKEMAAENVLFPPMIVMRDGADLC